MREKHKIEFKNLMAIGFKTSQACALKNMVRDFWQVGVAECASFFL